MKKTKSKITYEVLNYTKHIKLTYSDAITQYHCRVIRQISCHNYTRTVEQSNVLIQLYCLHRSVKMQQEYQHNQNISIAN
jgi:hypothetical protein